MTQLSVYLAAFAGESEALAATLAHLIPAGHDVTVLGSDDASLRACAERHQLPFLPCLSQQYPEGRYWCEILAALPRDAGRCLVLRAGTEVPEHWTLRLQPAAGSHPAVVFPLSVRHPCTTIFANTSHRPGLAVQAVDDWLNRYVPGRDYDVPVFCGWTALLNRQHIPDGHWQDDATLARALWESGAPLVASDQLYVDDSAFEAQTLPELLFPGWREAILHRHHLGAVRHALTELSDRKELPAADVPRVQPARLHVRHGWGGGLWRWVDDFIAADADCRNYVLQPIGGYVAFGQTMALFEGGADEPIAFWTLAQPILSTAAAHVEYQRILRDIINDYGVTEILVSSLIGQSLDILRTGLPTTVICHDFYPFCPPVFATWESPCTRCDGERLQDCLVNNPGHSLLETEPVSHWLALREAWLDAVLPDEITMVVPSMSVAERLQSLAPALQSKPFHVIAHGLPATLLAALSQVREAGVRQDMPERMRIVVLGGLSAHKGGTLLKAILEPLAEFADVLLMGMGKGNGGEVFEKIPGVTVVESYERDRLGELLAEQMPDLGLLLSTVPESFSYTLSELHASAIPVAATAMGAFADRIEPEVNGWLFPPQADAVLGLLKSLQREPERIAAVRRRLLLETPRDTVSMVADYTRLRAGGPSGLLRPRASQPADSHNVIHGSVYVRSDVSFREAWRGFMAYTAGKIRGTERIPRLLKRALLVFFRRY